MRVLQEGEIDTFRFRSHPLRLTQGGAVLLGIKSYEMTLCVGSLVARWFGTTHIHPILGLSGPGPAFAQLWPPTSRTLEWPPGTLSEDDLKTVIAEGEQGPETREVGTETP